MQIKTWFGAFTLHEDRITEVELFQKDIDSLVNRLMAEPLLLRGRVAGMDLRDLAVKYGFVESTDEYDRTLHEVGIALAKRQIAHAATPDRQIIAAVEAIDDLDETGNILAERLKEWYMLNFNETNLKGEELCLHVIGNLKGKAPSPKHGIIFRHPLVNNAPRRQRGKIARALALKISLAARYDYFSGELKEDLLLELKTKVEDIKKRYSNYDTESSLP